nr:immunoglobulin heavy chain junction region [Homo sapiens]
CARGHLLDSW